MAKYSGLTHTHLTPFVHILGILGILLIIVWTYYFRGGYDLTGNTVFNLHPLLMFTGFIFLSSQAIIAFKSVKGGRAYQKSRRASMSTAISYKTVSGDKRYQKAVHMILQGVAILLALVGIFAAYKFHVDNNIQNFYSLHSWFGLITITLYLIQWIVGFVTFWQQRVSPLKRTELLPWHVFLGLAAYTAALATAELGLLEKLTFLQKTGAAPLGLWSSEAMLVNTIGLVVFIFGAIVALTTIVPNPRKEEGNRALE